MIFFSFLICPPHISLRCKIHTSIHIRLLPGSFSAVVLFLSSFATILTINICNFLSFPLARPQHLEWARLKKKICPQMYECTQLHFISRLRILKLKKSFMFIYPFLFSYISLPYLFLLQILPYCKWKFLPVIVNEWCFCCIDTKLF